MRPLPASRRACARAVGAALLAVVALAGAASAQQAPAAPADSPAVSLGRRVTLRSQLLGEDRPVLVHLPRGYELRRDERFPVLYLLDGEALLTSVASTVDLLASGQQIPELIVIAVANTSRTRDMTPPSDGKPSRQLILGGRDTLETAWPEAGGAADFRRFLTEELRPWVDSTYRTTPYRVLVGGSLAGLFAIDAFAADPHAFDAVVAISPALWWNGGAHVRALTGALARAPLGDRALFMVTAGDEVEDITRPTRLFARTLRGRRDGFRWTYRAHATGSHGSAPLRGTLDALEWLFAGWPTPLAVGDSILLDGDLRRVERRRAPLVHRLGLSSAFSRWEYAEYAGLALDLGRPTISEAIAHAWLTDYRGSVSAYVQLADALSAQDRHAEALASHEEAVRAAERIGDPRLAGLRQALEKRRAAAASDGSDPRRHPEH